MCCFSAELDAKRLVEGLSIFGILSKIFSKNIFLGKLKYIIVVLLDMLLMFAMPPIKKRHLFSLVLIDCNLNSGDKEDCTE